MPALTLRRLRDSGEMIANAHEDVRGRKVLDNAGNHIGTVDGLMIDEDKKKVRFLQVECGGFLGLGATHLMIPVDVITSVSDDVVTIDRHREHLHGAPRYDPTLIKEMDGGFWGDIYGYYGSRPYWGTGYVDPPYPYYSR
jgi:sporulation protein YlmC with PRC-barrel domain